MSELVQKTIVFAGMIVTVIGLGLILNQYPNITPNQQLELILASNTNN